MDTSFYQGLKLILLDALNLSKDAIHMHIGLIVFFLAVVVWKKGRLELACILPVLLAALTMEVLDLYDDLNSLGHMRWSASFHDILNTIFWPFVIVFLAKAHGISRR